MGCVSIRSEAGPDTATCFTTQSTLHRKALAASLRSRLQAIWRIRAKVRARILEHLAMAGAS